MPQQPRSFNQSLTLNFKFCLLLIQQLQAPLEQGLALLREMLNLTIVLLELLYTVIHIDSSIVHLCHRYTSPWPPGGLLSIFNRVFEVAQLSAPFVL
jgi:hypothetical protein